MHSLRCVEILIVVNVIRYHKVIVKKNGHRSEQEDDPKQIQSLLIVLLRSSWFLVHFVL